jgi:hypothetical protein
LKIFKFVLAGAIALALAFCCGWFGGVWHVNHKNKPTPAPTPPPTPAPIVNPQPNNDSANQVLVIIGGNGSTEISKDKAETKLKRKVTPTPTPAAKPETVVLLNKTMPVKGQIMAKFINKKDNGDLGTQSQPLTGSATISGDTSNFKIAIDFSSQLVFGINIPERPRKLWHTGLYLVTNLDQVTLGGYGQRDFILMTLKDRVDILGFGRLELDDDKRILGGIELNF